MINIVKGQDKDLIIRLRDQDTEDPYDLSAVELIQACFVKDDGDSLFKQYLPITGDTLTASDIVSNIPQIDDIKEGQPITGPGIPASTTVLKTPTSATSPTAAGTIQLSAVATATATAASLLVGDITILSPAQWGKFKVSLTEDDTDVISQPDFEVKVRKAGVTLYKIFNNQLNVQERIC